MQGKVLTVIIIIISVRITPAYAGKSIAGTVEIPDTEDHPRVCREKTHSQSNYQV